MKLTFYIFFTFSLITVMGCKETKSKTEVPVIRNPNDLRKWIVDNTVQDFDRNTFGYDLRFIRQRKTPILLYDENFKAMVLLSPEYQGRVLTSTADGLQGYSFGWLNYDLIASMEKVPHMNAYGGEDRFWLGPEGGQFSLYFKPGEPFIYDNWQVPYGIDYDPFEIVSIEPNQVAFFKKLELQNYSNTQMDIVVSRLVRLLSPAAFLYEHGVQQADDIKAVGFESLNIIRNAGQNEWNKTTGMPSIWILGMFKPSPTATVVIPYREGPESTMGPLVTDDYFGKVDEDRLKTGAGVFYFKADGRKRSKIGVNTFRAKPLCGSFDEERGVLTIVEYSMPDTASDYVNSLWKIQDKPFAGDVVNAYNDGPLENGTQMGPFYEIESSSPAASLKPGESLEHSHRTLHFQGKEASLDAIAQKLLGVSLKDIRNAFE